MALAQRTAAEGRSGTPPRGFSGRRARRPGALGVQAGLIVDVETTGLDPFRDEIVELGLLLFALNARTGEALLIIDRYDGLREPTRSISSGAMAVHGLGPADLRGKALDAARVRRLVEAADFLVAHNAPFDYGFLTRLYPEAGLKPWHCSMRQINWRRYGFQSRRLENLAAGHGLSAAGAHRAGPDCELVFHLLQQRAPDGFPYLREMRGHRPLFRVGTA